MEHNLDEKIIEMAMKVDEHYPTYGVVSIGRYSNILMSIGSDDKVKLQLAEHLNKISRGLDNGERAANLIKTFLNVGYSNDTASKAHDIYAFTRVVFNSYTAAQSAGIGVPYKKRNLREAIEALRAAESIEEPAVISTSLLTLESCINHPERLVRVHDAIKEIASEQTNQHVAAVLNIFGHSHGLDIFPLHRYIELVRAKTEDSEYLLHRWLEGEIFPAVSFMNQEEQKEAYIMLLNGFFADIKAGNLTDFKIFEGIADPMDVL